jgi:hypothetical protein
MFTVAVIAVSTFGQESQSDFGVFDRYILIFGQLAKKVT